VKSLAMVPIRIEDPLGAIGAYWSRPHRATVRQVADLEALAQAAAVAVANADLFARLDRAVRIRDEFLALASHELNTPLTAVRLRVDALARAAREGAPAAMEVDRLAAVLGRLEDVVAGLGAFSRASRDGIELSPAPVDLREVVRRAAERVCYRARVDATSTPVTVLAPAPAIGEWDAARLSQAVTALLENAVKFGRGAPVRVEVADAPGEARVTVRDGGPGVPAADRERIFGRFERAAPASTHGGLGLGLWLARAIAEAHGGAIEVASEPGAGSAFTLRLPRRLPLEG
jgi:signal transduction histidine kinase